MVPLYKARQKLIDMCMHLMLAHKLKINIIDTID